MKPLQAQDRQSPNNESGDRNQVSFLAAKLLVTDNFWEMESYFSLCLWPLGDERKQK